MKPLKKKKCRNCPTMIPIYDSMVKACSVPCAIALVEKDKDAKVKREKKEFKKETVRLKKELNRGDMRWQHKQTQPVFNRLRVAEELQWFEDRGIEPTCISCQKTLGDDQWCCGHFKTVGANGRLRYDKRNTYLQHNRNCNMGKSGDIEGYKIGLVTRFGEAQGKAIIAYCEENNSPLKRSWQELEEMRAEFNRKYREIIKDRG